MKHRCKTALLCTSQCPPRLEAFVLKCLRQVAHLRRLCSLVPLSRHLRGRTPVRTVKVVACLSFIHQSDTTTCLWEVLQADGTWQPRTPVHPCEGAHAQQVSPGVGRDLAGVDDGIAWHMQMMRESCMNASSVGVVNPTTWAVYSCKMFGSSKARSELWLQRCGLRHRASVVAARVTLGQVKRYVEREQVYVQTWSWQRSPPVACPSSHVTHQASQSDV